MFKIVIGEINQKYRYGRFAICTIKKLPKTSPERQIVALFYEIRFADCNGVVRL